MSNFDHRRYTYVCMSICDDDECCMVDNDHGNVCKNVCLCAMVICNEIDICYMKPMDMLYGKVWTRM